MNNGENWYNPYLLTVQLDGILSMQYPEMSSMFRIQLKSANFKTKMVSIGQLQINQITLNKINQQNTNLNLKYSPWMQLQT